MFFHFLSEERVILRAMSELQQKQMTSVTYGRKKMNTDPKTPNDDHAAIVQSVLWRSAKGMKG